jgi:hypothetical protein
MAQIIPSDYAQFQRSGWHVPEIETLNTLRARLPADYTVFHGVHWTRESFGKTTFGELDLVIVNAAGRALVIEQKNGALQQTASGLVKTYPDGSKSVGEQVQRSLDGVRQKFKQVHGPGASLDLDYLIFCPDHRVQTLNAAALDLSRIVDAEQRDRLAERIEHILGPGLIPDPARAERVAAFFRQTFEVVPDIHAHVSQQEKAFTRLTGPLVQLVANLEMAPLRLRIYRYSGLREEPDRRPVLPDGDRPGEAAAPRLLQPAARREVEGHPGVRWPRHQFPRALRSVPEEPGADPRLR